MFTVLARGSPGTAEGGLCARLPCATVTIVPVSMLNPDPGSSFSNFRSSLNSRLLDERTVVLNEALTRSVAGGLGEQLAVLASESSEPVTLLVSNAPGGDVEAGLSIHDQIRSMSPAVTAIGSGRIAGAGLLPFVGASASHRFALPHVRFRFEEPRDSLESGTVSDLETNAEAMADRRQRVIEVLTSATGQSAERIEDDLSGQRGFDAEEAVAYGLVERIVQSRSEIE